MRRNIEKTIEEYKKKFCNTVGNDGAFFVSELVDIRNKAIEHGKGNTDEIIFNAIETALYFGFMIGYRSKSSNGKREGSRIKKLHRCNKVK